LTRVAINKHLAEQAMETQHSSRDLESVIVAKISHGAHSDAESGGDDGGSSGGNRRKPQVSLTDPQAAWVARKNIDPFFAYLIDNKAGIIVDAGGTRAKRIAEIAITETMIERVKTASIFSRSGSQARVFMVRSNCSSG
jgi:hypothetical protein